MTRPQRRREGELGRRTRLLLVAWALVAWALVAPPAAAQIIETPPGFLVEPDGLQWNHDVAYNSLDDEYLLVYPAQSSARALRLDPCGNVLGGELIYYTDPVDGMTMAAVAYNPDRNEYLALARHGDPSALSVRYLDAAGQPLSEPLPIVDRGGAPTIHYLPEHRRYLVRWDFAYDNTWYRMVDGDSSATQPLLGGVVQIAADGFSGRAAYSATHDRTLFVFTVDGPPPDRADLYGRFATGNGETVTARFPLVTGFENQQNPQVVYMASTGEWLVTWEEWKDAANNHAADVGALFVDANGVVTRRFSIMQTADDLWEVPGPMVYDPVTDRVLVTWFMGTATRMRELAPADGSLGPEWIVSNNNDAPTSIALRPHPLNPQVLVTWRRGYNGVYAGIWSLAGRCTDVSVADDAELVSADLPVELGCREAATAHLTLRNVGDSPWTREATYFLGAVDNTDPFHSDPRVWLPRGASVAPGATFTFDVALVGPGQGGTYVTDWQMVQQATGFFGDVASAEVRVTCEGGGPGPAGEADASGGGGGDAGGPDAGAGGHRPDAGGEVGADALAGSGGAALGDDVRFEGSCGCGVPRGASRDGGWWLLLLLVFTAGLRGARQTSARSAL